MTCGIYALYWQEQDLIYIGQSDDIERRFTQHTQTLTLNKHSNYRVQRVYDIYGNPDLLIIERCSIPELNYLEILWTKEFRALDPVVGLCLVEAGQVGWGVNSNGSKYSKRQILTVFSLVSKSNLTLTKIASRAKVPKHVVENIRAGSTHKWLSEVYPALYKTMQQRKPILNTINNAGSTASFVSPEGVVYTNITSISDFVRLFDWPNVKIKSVFTSFSKLYRNKVHTYKGWKKYTVS